MIRNLEAEQIACALALAVEEGDKEAFYALWNEERSAEEWKLIAGQAVKMFWDLVGYVERDLLPEAVRYASDPEEMNRDAEHFEEVMGVSIWRYRDFADWFRRHWKASSPTEGLQSHLQVLVGEAAQGHDSWSVEEVLAWRASKRDS